MNGYLVTISGDYYGTPRAGDRKKEKFQYSIQVKVPKPEGALSLIKNKLLDKVLRRNYGNYHTYRTHQITSITNLDGSKVVGLTDPRLMDFNDLAIYVQQKRLPLKLDLYTDLDYFRTMVYLSETNLRAFKVKQAQLEKDVSIDKELAELNPELLKPVQSSERLTTTDATNREKEFYDSKAKPEPVLKDSNLSDLVDRTSIIQKHDDGAKEPDKLFGNILNDAPASTLVTEDKPPAQKVEKVYVEGKGYVNAEDFKENFEKEGEEPYEVYDPTKVGVAPSEETQEVAAEPDDINVDKL